MAAPRALLRKRAAVAAGRAASEALCKSAGLPLGDAGSAGQAWCLAAASGTCTQSKPLHAKIALDKKKAATEAARNEVQREQGSELASAEGALRGSEACKKKLPETTQACLGAEEAAMLNIATLKGFEKPAAALLDEAFALACKLGGAAKRQQAPSKGAADDARGPTKCCKKTKGPFLHEIACNMRPSPAAAKAPGRPPAGFGAEGARRLRHHPSFNFRALSAWALLLLQRIGTLLCTCQPSRSRAWELLASTTASLLAGAAAASTVPRLTAPRLTARKLLACLPMHLAPCAPSEKAQLLPGGHWAWPSLCSKLLARLCTLLTRLPGRSCHKRP